VRILVRHNRPSEELAKQGWRLRRLTHRGRRPAGLWRPEEPGIARSGVRGDRDGHHHGQLGPAQRGRQLTDSGRAGEPQPDRRSKGGRGAAVYLYLGPGADANHPVPLFQAKGVTDAYLRGSGMGYTILAPNAFMEVWAGMVVGMPLMAGQPVTLVGECRRLHSFISQGDVAAFAVASVGHPAAMNQSLYLGGPEPYAGVTSWRLLGGCWAARSR